MATVCKNKKHINSCRIQKSKGEKNHNNKYTKDLAYQNATHNPEKGDPLHEKWGVPYSSICIYVWVCVYLCAWRRRFSCFMSAAISKTNEKINLSGKESALSERETTFHSFHSADWSARDPPPATPLKTLLEKEERKPDRLRLGIIGNSRF